MTTYNHSQIEPKWQKFWEDNKLFKAEIDYDKEKLYVLDMFPYPSAEGLHVGHPEGYTATDIFSRYKRMKGYNVLHVMGWDAFGLPAEQHAVKTGKHPAVTTRENIENFRKQIKSLGFSYDWDREVDTTDPSYYKWTQWIFLKLFEKGLAYQDEMPVNWCPEMKAVLANEEVKDGVSDIGGFPVIRKPMRQWVLKITEYAERLLADIEGLDWSESIKEMQRNWIGKSEGARTVFHVFEQNESFEIYTTRPDTLFGATFCVLAPEHPLVDKITTPECLPEVNKFKEECAALSDKERTDDSKDKKGVFTGAYATNPVNGKKIPIWISDYVLISYGTGAIMAVPAHDQRDYEFAKKYGLEIIEVVEGKKEKADKVFSGYGTTINSGFLSGMESRKAKSEMIRFLEEKGLGKAAVGYKLRDWIFSRQRYWGEPIPVLLDENNNPTPLKESDLPLLLPEIEDFLPNENGESPLAKAGDWLEVELPDGRKLKRETNTMPQWAGSCWYYLRFLDPRNTDKAWSEEAEKYWGSVDLYIGGAEHAVLHLLYARFWHKVLFDLGYVSNPEPFLKLVNQGMILGSDNQKMSKSRGNGINPDDMIREYGADSVRLYEMFMGPLEKSKPWQTNGIEGIHRFLKRIWNFFVNEDNQLSDKISDKQPALSELKIIHKSIKKVGGDIEQLKLNTAISQLMICLNEFHELKKISRQTAAQFILILSPFAPHLAEEIWQIIGKTESLAYETWPAFEEKYCEEDQINLPIQINGKMRKQLTVDANIDEETLMKLVHADEKLKTYLETGTIRKIIFIPKKILNLVIQ